VKRKGEKGREQERKEENRSYNGRKREEKGRSRVRKGDIGGEQKR
jgi:hypothetical protein